MVFWKTHLIFGILLLLYISRAQAQDIVLNEVMSSNALTLADEDGDYPDWIELFNRGSLAVNLNGWSLSDDPNDPGKWQFSDLSIAPASHLLVFASGKDRVSSVLEWDAVIQKGDSCRYLNVTNTVTEDWTAPEFDDHSWKNGPTGLGYGDEDDATIVPGAQCIYLRQAFNIANVSAVEKLLLHMDFDDAFVTYLNGVEIARANIGASGVRPLYNLSANEPREALMYQDGAPLMFDLQSFIGILQSGKNVLSTEVHNYGSSSSDLSIIPFLSIGYTETGLSSRQPDSILNLPISGLHTNFKIKSSGETLILSDNLLNVIDSFPSESIPNDISKGRYPDGSDDWYFFDQPTPNRPNDANGYQNFASMVETSENGGFYNAPLSVILSTSESDRTIYYTRDGSIPDQNSPIYDHPLLISETTVLRARVLHPGYLPGAVNTQTYFIDENRDLPVISLSTNPDNLWDFNTGIYATGPNAESEFPYFGANFWEDWEREAHIEFFDDGGLSEFSTGCGIKIFGGWSRGFPQKSVSLFFRSKYGVSTLEYPIFPELDIQSFEALVLRNSGNDWDFTMMRDGMMGSLLSDLDVDKQAYRPAVLFINGAYWGIQNIREKINEHFIASHHNVDPKNIDMLESDQQVIHGDNENYLQLIDYIETHNMNTDAAFNYLIQKMEITEFFDYAIAQIYFDNTDWPGNNIKYWRPKTTDGRWRWILYDTDFGFGLFAESAAWQNNTLAFALEENGPEWPNPPWSTLLLRKILENQKLKNQFINYFSDHLNVTFRSDRVLDLISETRNKISSEMPEHVKRWNHDLDNWNMNINRLNLFAQNRVAYLRQYLMQEFNLSAMNLVSVTISDSGMGTVELNGHLEIKQDFKGHYFSDIPIQLKALPNQGFRFTGWSGSYSSQSAELAFFPEDNPNITAHFEKSAGGLNSIVINEINYNSSDSFDSGDWVEFLNTGNQTIDMTGWVFKDEDDSHQFIFPQGTVLESESLLVILKDETSFRSKFPDVKNYVSGMNFGLSGAGELVRLYNAQMEQIDSLVYDDKTPWPEDADGNGASLELINPFKENSLPGNWAASAGHGSPGKRNSVYTNIKENQKTELAHGLFLEQNYPNPFNPTTVISYQLPVASYVNLVIFNGLGQKVRILVEEKQKAGTHLVTFNADGLASGIYFCTLSFGNNKLLIKKMILMH